MIVIPLARGFILFLLACLQEF
eukprot:COSAG02_NODE_55683_length_289_cov_0.810526_2_plen_21_part_01